jgi:hypothetical protein
MKLEVQKREKKREKDRAQRRAYEVLIQGGTDLIRRLISEKDIVKKKSVIDEIDALRIYINELLAKINERLKLSVPQYTSDWGTTYPFSPTAKKQEKAKMVKDAVKAGAAAVATEVAANTLVNLRNPATPTQ